MSNYTEGPWTLCYDGQIDGLKGEYVCSFRTWDTYKEFISNEEQKATARLITAAPELLEALKEAVRLAEENIPLRGQPFVNCRIAIKKAEKEA